MFLLKQSIPEFCDRPERMEIYEYYSKNVILQRLRM